MENSLDALRAQVRYRRHDLEVEADQARLARAVRSRRGPRLFTRRDARRLHAEVTAFVAGAAPADQRPVETTSAGTRRR
jgi:hypothetical protein